MLKLFKAKPFDFGSEETQLMDGGIDVREIRNLLQIVASVTGTI